MAPVRVRTPEPVLARPPKPLMTLAMLVSPAPPMVRRLPPLATVPEMERVPVEFCQVWAPPRVRVPVRLEVPLAVMPLLSMRVARSMFQLAPVRVSRPMSARAVSLVLVWLVVPEKMRASPLEGVVSQLAPLQRALALPVQVDWAEAEEMVRRELPARARKRRNLDFGFMVFVSLRVFSVQFSVKRLNRPWRRINADGDFWVGWRWWVWIVWPIRDG